MYYCGWDGGGTKTEVCILGPDGQEQACASFGPLNVNGAALETVAQTARDCVAFMASQPGGCGSCAALVIGMAGVSNQNAAALLEKAVRAAGYRGKLRIVGDQEIALSGAVQGPGAVLIAGTGAICFGKDQQGNPFRVGGYGYLIDDGGSGYAIGRDILAAAARAVDGRGPETALRDMVFSQLNVSDIGGVITWLYRPETGKKEVASLAPLLLRALETGDAAAQAIAAKAAKDLAELAITAWRKTGMTGGELALTGSVMNHYPLIRAQTEALIRAALPDAVLLSPRHRPARGAALLAIAEIEKNKA